MAGTKFVAFLCFLITLMHTGAAHGRSWKGEIIENGFHRFGEAETVKKNVNSLSGGISGGIDERILSRTVTSGIGQEKPPKTVTVRITNNSGGVVQLHLEERTAWLKTLQPGDTYTYVFEEDEGDDTKTDCYATRTNANGDPFHMVFSVYKDDGNVLPRVACGTNCRWRIDQNGASAWSPRTALHPFPHWVQGYNWQPNVAAHRLS